MQLNLLSPLTFSGHETWLTWLHEMLPKPHVHVDAPVVFDLFAGCGGLALGFEIAGFQTHGFEMKPQAVKTYNTNLSGTCEDVTLDIGMPEGKADVLIGGPPCQPFSQIGYQRGKRDPRDGFPVFLNAVERIQPKIAIIENVRGLLYRNKDYLRKAIAELEKFGYDVDAKLFKMLDYGVPQKRERVVIVASQVGWQWPEPFTSQKVTVEMALGPLTRQHDQNSRFLTPSMDKYIAAYEKKSQCVRPRDLHLDQPSRTVTCRNLGVAKQVRHYLASPRQIMGQQARIPIHLVQSPYAKELALVKDNPIAIKKEQSLNIIRAVGIPVREMTPRRRERLALALLAVVRLQPNMNWHEAQSYFDNGPTPITTREIIRFWNTYYSETIAESSYDDVRRKDLIYLVEAGLVEKSAADPMADTNDGTRGYAVNRDGLKLIQAYDGDDWDIALLNFRDKMGVLSDRLSRSRDFQMVPVTLPNGEIVLRQRDCNVSQVNERADRTI